MKIFQTPAGEKKGLWHIFDDEDYRRISAICNSGSYWFGGYLDNKPNQTREKVKTSEYSEDIQLCPACVERAYIVKLIKVIPIK